MRRIASLVVKDFRVLRTERLAAVSFLYGLLFSVFMASLGTITGVFITFYFIAIRELNAFGADERYRADCFIASLPVRRRDVVIARYAGVAFTLAVFLGLSYVVNVLLLFLGHPAARPLGFGYCMMVLAGVATYTAIGFPAYFLVGATKARAVSVALLIVPFAGGSLLFGLGPSVGLLPASAGTLLSAPFSLDPLLTAVIAGAGLLLWAASIPVSVRLYTRRDL